MVVKMHFLFRDMDGNLQDAYVPCFLESEQSLVSSGGIVLVESLEGMIVDTTALRHGEEIMKAHMKAVETVIEERTKEEKETKEEKADEENRGHSPRCLLSRDTNPRVCNEDYGIKTRLDDRYRELEIIYQGRVIATLPVKYCPFCGKLL